MARRIQSLDELRRPRAAGAAQSIPTKAASVVRILGIDPGSRFTGWGVIEARGSKLNHVAHGVIRAGEGPLPPRLKLIHQQLAAVIAEYRPQEYAVEEVFMRVNVGTALILGQARGVAVLAGAVAGLPFAEYARLEEANKNSDDTIAAENFWVSKFSYGAPVLDLPVDRPRPAMKTYKGAMEKITIDPERFERLKKASPKLGGTVSQRCFPPSPRCSTASPARRMR